MIFNSLFYFASGVKKNAPASNCNGEMVAERSAYPRLMNKETERLALKFPSFVGIMGGFFHSINQLINQSINWFRRGLGGGVFRAFALSAFCFLLSAVTLSAQFAGGSGTAEDPYTIATPAQLAYLSTVVNANTAPFSAAGVNFKLTADIDLSEYGETFNNGEGWIPIGNYIGNNTTGSFKGVFDGDGHIITGLYIRHPRTILMHFGLFGYGIAGSVIKNVGVVDADINVSATHCGGIIGYITGGTITNCWFTGSIVLSEFATINAGGIAGANTATTNISNCFSAGSITGIGNSVNNGGIVGGNNISIVSNCWSTAEIYAFATTTANAGGIAGQLFNANSRIENCAALNPHIAATGTTRNRGRVAGIRPSGTLLNNIAFDEMINYPADAWTNTESDQINGADITVTQILADGTLDGRFNEPWITETGKLPGLNQVVTPPSYFTENLLVVTGVVIEPKQSVVRKGETQTFTVTVLGFNLITESVIWSVEGGSAGTSITNAGVITIDPNETAFQLTVKAVSTEDETKYNTAIVRVRVFEGSGTSASPYIINTADQLATLAMFVNENNRLYNNNTYYKLESDIDLSDYGANFNNGEGWIPIGNEEFAFRGYFNMDGDNHIITGLYINSVNSITHAGLFGRTTNSVFENIGVVEVNITVTHDQPTFVGGLGGLLALSEITNCYTTGSITVYHSSDSRTGGIGGQGPDLINCWSSATVTSINTNPVYSVGEVRTGGLAGQAGNDVTNCYFTGSVLAVGNLATMQIGGITGLGNRVTGCWTSGKVSGIKTDAFSPTWIQINNYLSVGGIAGLTSAAVSNCYSTAIVLAHSETAQISAWAGGIIGYGSATNSIAINPLVKSTGNGGKSYRRISAMTTGGLSNNSGFTGMFGENGRTDCWTANTATNTDGADITLEQILADGTLGGLFTSAGGWTTENGKLPGFGAAMDLYLTGSPFIAEIIVTGAGVAKGTSKTMEANVVGFNTNGTVTWEVEGGISGTSITSAGVLTVAAGETANKLIVTATSSEDNTKSQSEYIMITTAGSGSETDPYIITTLEELITLSELVNNHNLIRLENFKLGADIDMSDYRAKYNAGSGWSPIGRQGVSFDGSFDGDGHIISNLYCEYISTGPFHSLVGFFGYVENATIKNLGIVDAVFDVMHPLGNSWVEAGGIAGRANNTTIDNCYVTGSITAISTASGSAASYAAGIAGLGANTVITNCWTDMNIYTENSGSTFSIAAGIAGLGTISISKCYSMGSIITKSNNNLSIAAGIVANNSSGEISNCWSSAIVKSYGATETRIGGIAVSNSTNLAILTNNVALNPALECEGTLQRIGRISGNNAIFENNYGFEEMMHPNEDGTWENIGANLLDGANIDRLTINTDGTLGGLFTAEDGWAIENGKLPGIGAPVDMPLHLIMPDGTFTVSGKVTGINIEDELEGVVVTLSGPTNYSATTDVSGNYVIENVDGGMIFNYTLRATLYGYFTYETTILVLTDLEHDITLNAIPKYTISGNVTGSTIPGPVEDVEITLTGFGEFSTTTDESGHYSIEVYDGYTYTLLATKDDYAEHTTEITIDGEDVIHSFSMVENLIPPGSVTASEVGDNVVINWNEPSTPVTFRYDSGIVTNRIGFDNGNFPNSVFGSCHRVGASLTSISWNTNVTPVNVRILALNAEGKPSTTVLYSASNIPGTSQEWSTHQFPEAVEAPNGFFISVGQATLTNIGIGFSAGTTDYPFMSQTNFYASNYLSGSFTPLDGTQFEGNFMVRAEGISMGKSVIFGYQENQRGLSGYNVYRLPLGQENNDDNWTQIVTNISETTCTDTDWSLISWGQYRYAVRAVYSIGLSSPVFSNIVNNKMLVDYSINITTNSGLPATGATVTLTNQDDPSRVHTLISGADGVFVTDVWRGMYSLKVALAGYEIYTAEDLDITDIDLSYDVDLIDEVYPVGSVSAKLEGANAVIEWAAGIPPVNEWINWCLNDEVEGRIGYGAVDGEDMTMAIRFTPADLAANRVVSGHTINKVAIGIGSNMAQVTSMEIRIWQGGTGINAPGQLLYTQPITNYATFAENTMVEIALTTPFVIDASRELRIGWRLVNTAGYPFGRDIGPCVAPGKSDLFICPVLNNGAWVSYSAVYGWNNNISIKAFVSNGELRVENGELFAETVGAYPMWSPEMQNHTFSPKTHTVGAYPMWSPTELKIANGEFFAQSIDFESNSINQLINQSINRSPVGFTIYRLLEGQTDDWTMLAENITTMEYTDIEWADLAEGIYQYAVVSIFGSGESEAVLSNSLVKEPELPDYYTVTVTAGTGGTVEIEGYDNLTELIEAGTSITVKATANQNYDFIEWTDIVTGETISSLPVYSFTVSEDVTLVAHFELVGINVTEIGGFTIYPNPATSEIYVAMGHAPLSDNNVEIFDVFGRKQNAESGMQNGELVVDISHLPAGVYMIRLFDGQNYVTQRFVKK